MSHGRFPKTFDEQVVVICSVNPGKIEAVIRAFQKLMPQTKFRFQSFEAKSGVSPQPIGYDETLLGANNRIKSARAAYPESDFHVAIEAGITHLDSRVFESIICLVENQSKKQGLGFGPSFQVPPPIYKLVKSGLELSDATDEFYRIKQSKHHGGIIATLTGEVISRADLCSFAVSMALLPFLHPQDYE